MKIEKPSSSRLSDRLIVNFRCISALNQPAVKTAQAIHTATPPITHHAMLIYPHTILALSFKTAVSRTDTAQSPASSEHLAKCDHQAPDRSHRNDTDGEIKYAPFAH